MAWQLEFDEIILINVFKTKWDVGVIQSCSSKGQMLRMGVMSSLTMSTQTGISLAQSECHLEMSSGRWNRIIVLYVCRES